MQLAGAGANQNLVQGNVIGTDITGTVALANQQGDLQLDQGAENNTIGGLIDPAGVFHGYDFASATSTADLTFHSDLSGPPQGQTGGGPTAVYPIDMETGGELLAIVHAQGFNARLVMLDSQGRVIIQSDGLSPSDPDPVIHQYLSPGRYSLVVESTRGAGTYALTTSLALTSPPFQAVPADGGTTTAQSMVAGDFTGDGRADLAVVNYYAVSVLLGNGDGTFQPPVSYTVGTDAWAIVTGDFNGDGRTDLAIANYGTPTQAGTVSVLLNNGDGTFQPAVNYAYALGSQLNANKRGLGELRAGSIVAGDFTGDGRTDLAVVGTIITVFGRFPKYQIVGASIVSVLLGNGDGTFQSPVQYTAADVPSLVEIVAGDFRGDGLTDLAVLNRYGTGPGFVSVLLGNGDGTFQPQVSYTVGDLPYAIAAGDFNGDGRTDLAVANSYADGVSVLLANSDGSFQPSVTYAVGYSPSAIVAGDFTGDGRMDLAVSDADGVQMLLGNGDGTFQPAKTVADVGGYLASGDFNGDGRTDLATITE